EMLLDFYAWVIGTASILIVGEMIPKFIARAYPERTSLVVLPWLSSLRRFTLPVLDFLMKPLTTLFPRLSTPSGSIFTFTLEELKSVLEEDRRGRTGKDESMDMIQRSLEIHDRRAETIMTPLSKMDFIEIDPPGKPRSPDFLIDRIVEEGHTRTPVKRGGK